MDSSRHLSLQAIFDLAQKALLSNGFSDSQSAAIARNVCKAQIDECHSHGLFRIPFYINALKNESANPSAVPELVKNDKSIVHIDGKNGFCPVALELGLPVLAEKAKEFGIAAMAIHNVYNIAALWPEVERLAEDQLIGFAFTASNAFVAPAGGISPLYGTNPMAFAWPRSGKPPLVFDQASSASARGEIQLHARAGQSIPDGWAIDAQGNPTNNPEEALKGAQLPFGGHKGSSIALMVELLAGALIGDLFSYESSQKDTHGVGAPSGGEFLIAINPTACVLGEQADSQQSRAEMLFEKLLSQPGTRLPSSRRYEARKRSEANGVDIPEKLFEEITALIQ